MLKMVWVFAICDATFEVRLSIKGTNGVTMQITVKRMVPIMLKDRWMMVVRLALRLVPIAARSAVIQVPIF